MTSVASITAFMYDWNFGSNFSRYDSTSPAGSWVSPSGGWHKDMAWNSSVTKGPWRRTWKSVSYTWSGLTRVNLKFQRSWPIDTSMMATGWTMLSSLFKMARRCSTSADPSAPLGNPSWQADIMSPTRVCLEAGSFKSRYFWQSIATTNDMRGSSQSLPLKSSGFQLTKRKLSTAFIAWARTRMRNKPLCRTLTYSRVSVYQLAKLSVSSVVARYRSMMSFGCSAAMVKVRMWLKVDIVLKIFSNLRMPSKLFPTLSNVGIMSISISLAIATALAASTLFAQTVHGARKPEGSRSRRKPKRISTHSWYMQCWAVTSSMRCPVTTMTASLCSLSAKSWKNAMMASISFPMNAGTSSSLGGVASASLGAIELSRQAHLPRRDWARSRRRPCSGGASGWSRRWGTSEAADSLPGAATICMKSTKSSMGSRRISSQNASLLVCDSTSFVRRARLLLRLVPLRGDGHDARLARPCHADHEVEPASWQVTTHSAQRAKFRLIVGGATS
ncbi:unnamed protein product [Prorocentrum cordatum]|uniref:Uncharacterized protein n=1 Tax=Prorocentrum cordatum TaxID=2364126 RepID=A0ABN9UEV7_9DINO|nr:unnamed protein product [Polarella glacialis]